MPSNISDERKVAETALSKEYLNTLLNHALLIHTSDERMFMGQFKCTDNECNIILSQAYEYRNPSAKAVSDAAKAAARQGEEGAKADMTSRFMGLVVVPGEHIIKIEVEDKSRGSYIK